MLFFAKLFKRKKQTNLFHDEECNYTKRAFVIVLVFTCVSKPISYWAQMQMLTDWATEGPAVVVRVMNSPLKQHGK